jgi:DNA mismatch repair ATPase MutS
LITLAAVAKDFSLIRPSMSDEPVLLISEGRHLLYEHYCQQNEQQYITNDTLLCGGESDEYCSMVRFLGGLVSVGILT